MRLIIAGSRTIERSEENMDKIFDWLNKMTQSVTITEVLDGGANGADMIGALWAISKGIPVKKYPADWEEYGKSAGPIRNETMAHNADLLALIWDGKSRGSKHMLETANKLKLKTRQLIIDTI